MKHQARSFNPMSDAQLAHDHVDAAARRLEIAGKFLKEHDLLALAKDAHDMAMSTHRLRDRIRKAQTTENHA